MNKLLKKTKLVKQILEEVPEARCDDCCLLIEYYKRTNTDINKPFVELLTMGQIKDIPSVVRTRQKVQEQYPHLCEEECWNKRHKYQKVFVDYALNIKRNHINNL